MTGFVPQLAIFRQQALDYPLGQKLHKFFNSPDMQTAVEIIGNKGPFPLDYDLPFREKFHRAKKIVVVSVRSLNKFQTCKPSAHYQLPLISGCPAHCHYCYLSTNLGQHPYIKIYVNIEEILSKARKYIKKRQPEITIFEGSATSDPLALEAWTGSLSRAINFFARTEQGKFRFVTKFIEVEPLLKLKHRGQTEFRFSLNTPYIINKFEPATPDLQSRLKAASRVYRAGYPLGFLIAPIFNYENWEIQYGQLFKTIMKTLKTEGKGIFFELISHRFTASAKKIIEQAYPHTDLPMEEAAREFKYGQFGYGKYLYPKKTLKKMEETLSSQIKNNLPCADIKYFV
ncbi:MAG: spore photoproduct lyase [Bacillota bacterium]